jgi:hypothetical protein
MTLEKGIRNAETIDRQTRARKIVKALGSLVARLFPHVPAFVFIDAFEAGINAAKSEAQECA